MAADEKPRRRAGRGRGTRVGAEVPSVVPQSPIGADPLATVAYDSSIPAPADAQEISVNHNPLLEHVDSVTGTFTAPSLDAVAPENPLTRVVAPGEALQLVRYALRGNTLVISGLTPHGRRLTFEQREDRDGWYVVVAGRRRRPTERELGLVVASISQEMDAAMAPEGEAEVRAAYQLAVASDQPGMPLKGIQAYRDLLLDEVAAFCSGQTQRLAVVAIEYQAFKRFALRHGHRIGAAFVRALGERLSRLFADEKLLHVFHKHGKSFRLIVLNRSLEEIDELIQRITSLETKQWLVERVWGKDLRTHADEVNFHIGVARATVAERESNYLALAQRLNDEAYRASKLGQLLGHTSLVLAKSDYRTTVYHWQASSEDELADLASRMDDGPADVSAELVDYLHELAPADLEGMSVDGDLKALLFKAIARDGFWQGTTAMRIAGERLVARLLSQEPAPEGEQDHVAGFDLGDEFYGIALEDGRLYFAWGDLNSAGSTRLRAGLERLQRAVGWRQPAGGIVGRFVDALAPRRVTRRPSAEQQGDDDTPTVVLLTEPSLPARVRRAAQESFEQAYQDEELRVNDAVDIGEHLWTTRGEQAQDEDIQEGAELFLSLRGQRRRVRVLERRSGFRVLLEIDGAEHPAAVSNSIIGPVVKLRIRNAVVSAAVCVLETTREELLDMLSLIQEDNNWPEHEPMDVVGFLRHIADILLAEQVKNPAKIELALGASYEADNFVGVYSLEDVRERHPGLFYEAVHVALLEPPSHEVDRQLAELIAHTMLSIARPEV